jgi:hypothetical protein
LIEPSQSRGVAIHRGVVVLHKGSSDFSGR